MPKGIYKVPVAVNEPIKTYASGSPERKELQAMLRELRSKKTNKLLHNSILMIVFTSF